MPRHIQKGGLGHRHNPKKGGLRHGHNPKKGGLGHRHESKKGGLKNWSCTKWGFGSLFYHRTKCLVILWF